MITEDYVSFETAKLLKEKGFDGMCAYINYPPSGRSLIGHSINNTDLQLTREAELCIDKENLLTIPTLQMAMKWLREVHKLHITVYSCSQESWAYRITKPHQTLENGAYAGDYASCEEACEAAVKYCLKNLI